MQRHRPLGELQHRGLPLLVGHHQDPRAVLHRQRLAHQAVPAQRLAPRDHQETEEHHRRGSLADRSRGGELRHAYTRELRELPGRGEGARRHADRRGRRPAESAQVDAESRGGRLRRVRAAHPDDRVDRRGYPGEPADPAAQEEHGSGGVSGEGRQFRRADVHLVQQLGERVREDAALLDEQEDGHRRWQRGRDHDRGVHTAARVAVQERQEQRRVASAHGVHVLGQQAVSQGQ